MSGTPTRHQPTASRPGHPLTSRRQVGAVEVVALSDGRTDLPAAIFPDADTAVFGDAAFPVCVNAFLLRMPGRTCLVDAGTGGSGGDTLGHVAAALASVGTAPDEIDVVLMTHLHADHAGGLRDGAGQAFYPNAELFVAEPEAAFWLDDGLPARAPDAIKPTIALATGAVGSYAGRTTRFAPSGEVVPGITAVALPGHTPGHTGFLVESEGERLFVWADTVHVASFQVEHPDWTVGFDVDGQAGVASRRRAFEMAASEHLAVAGMHLDFPGFGRLVRSGSGYAYEPSEAL